MPGKRKRTRPGQGDGGAGKRPRVSGTFNGSGKDTVVKNALLTQFYPRVVSLREYLLSKLPPASKVRRKKILTVGRNFGTETCERDQALVDALDQILIGISKASEQGREERWQQWTLLSHKDDTEISTLTNINGAGIFSQSEIVDFTIWLLFSKASNGRVQHLLCQGFRKDVSARSVRRAENFTSAIPGVISVYPNSYVTAMKAAPWPRVLALMGKEGERAMVDLLMDCGVFLPVENGHGNYYQLSGQPLGDVKPSMETHRLTEPQVVKANSKLVHSVEPATMPIRTPANITFVRNRMLYARAALNAQGGVKFGLRHIHVFNQQSYHTKDDRGTPTENNSTTKPDKSTIHVMMYIFPRQFGLHNVFTHSVDYRETVHAFKDYTLREDEIDQKYPSPSTVKIPKRLRGRAVALVQKLQILHNRCSYKKLLDYYCPALDGTRNVAHSNKKQDANSSSLASFKTQESINIINTVSESSSPQLPPTKTSLADFSNPISQVSAFCRAVLAHLIPHELWGTGEIQAHNEKVLYRNVDRFIRLRRFESLSLHEVFQGTKLADIEWLCPPEPTKVKLSQSDVNKRIEIIHELIYYVFDSILIPLIRTNFHVTESTAHRYRLLYFRHDVWRSIAEPEMASLKVKMFEEIKLEQAQTILGSRALGFSQVRLLPKDTGVRPIMNLRRRTLKPGNKGMLGSSINTVLAPVYNVLTLELASNPDRLKSALFCVGDLYAKLKSFRSTMQMSSKPLYFAKVDVRAAFDTIPQNAVLRLISSIPSESEYLIAKHFEVKPGLGFYEGNARTKPMHKWTALAKPLDDIQSFEENLESKLATGRKNTVFVENVVNQVRTTDELLQLLADHVKYNMVKIGKKYYRQKEGIPQGSVLSSLLCNYFYADLEMQHLQFLNNGESLLLRLIDDSLLITTNPKHAKQFLQIMHDGLPAYGVQVNPDKTLANFEATINGRKVPRLVGTRKFPYCGSFIDTKTLDISKDRDRNQNLAITDSLTVEYSKMPGRSFHRKVLNMFKVQAHAMFFDTTLNSNSTVLLNIYTAFIETATKMWSYARCLPTRKQPTMSLVIKTIRDAINLAFVLLRSKSRKKNDHGFKCTVSRTQLEWLAMTAFRHVLGRRQSKYGTVIAWLDTKMKWVEGNDSRMIVQMSRTIRGHALKEMI